jgi:hypothetical protein
MRSVEPLAAILSPAVEQYAHDMNEPSWIVDIALRRLLRAQPGLSEHPVASGQLLREIRAVRNDAKRGLRVRRR